jgi:hypothetical protein
MRINLVRGAAVLSIVLVSCAYAYPNDLVSNKAEIVNKLSSKNEGTIFQAYEMLVDNNGRVKLEYRNDARIRNALWDAFRFLVPVPAEIKSSESETNTTADYLLYVMGDVMELRATPYIMKNFYVSGFRDSLARMGDSAVPLVLKVFTTGGKDEKLNALDVLKTMLEPKPKEIAIGYDDPVKGLQRKIIANSEYGFYEAAGAVRDEIRKEIKKHLGQGDRELQLNTLGVYAYVAEEDDVAYLEGIAKNDPYKVRSFPPTINKSRYPFREAAQKALDNIEMKKTVVRGDLNDVSKSTGAY